MCLGACVCVLVLAHVCVCVGTFLRACVDACVVHVCMGASVGA